MIIKKGSKGDIVRSIQVFLKIKDDGDFGDKTKNAVISYQKLNGLNPDGVVGKDTLNKMLSQGLSIIAPEIKPIGITNDEVLNIIKANSHNFVFPTNEYNKKETTFDYTKHLVVVAIRGFKLDIGAKGQNDRGIYDDAHFIYTPSSIISFPANTDPSGFRKGYGTGSNKGMAMVDEGVWAYNKGTHKGRLAFRPSVPIRVIRDGNPPYPHTGWHATNWHNGNISTTSSLGCQTNAPSDFDTLRVYIYNQLEKLQNPKMFNDFNVEDYAFPYILIDEVERRKGNLVV